MITLENRRELSLILISWYVCTASNAVNFKGPAHSWSSGQALLYTWQCEWRERCSVEGITNLWHACPKWHAEIFPSHAVFTAVSILFLRPTSVSVLRRTCVFIYIYTHTHTYLTPYRLHMNYRCYQTTPRRNIFKQMWSADEKCWLDIYRWGAGLAVTGPIGDTGQNVWRSAFVTGSGSSSSSSSYCHVFCLIAFIEVAFIINLINILINCTI